MLCMLNTLTEIMLMIRQPCLEICSILIEMITEIIMKDVTIGGEDVMAKGIKFSNLKTYLLSIFILMME